MMSLLVKEFENGMQVNESVIDNVVEMVVDNGCVMLSDGFGCVVLNDCEVSVC